MNTLRRLVGGVACILAHCAAWPTLAAVEDTRRRETALEAMRALAAGGKGRDAQPDWLIPAKAVFARAFDTAYGRTVLALRYDGGGADTENIPYRSFEIEIVVVAASGTESRFELIEYPNARFNPEATLSLDEMITQARKRRIEKAVVDFLYQKWSRAVLSARYGNTGASEAPSVSLLVIVPEVGVAIATSSTAQHRSEAAKFQQIGELLRQHIRRGESPDNESLLRQLKALDTSEPGQ